MSGDTFLYLETRGRKTGVLRKIEIWFVQHAQRLYVVAEMRERAQWVQNLSAHPEVHVSIGTCGHETDHRARTRARARIVDAAREPELSAAVRALMDAKYAWSDGLIVEIAPAGE